MIWGVVRMGLGDEAGRSGDAVVSGDRNGEGGMERQTLFGLAKVCEERCSGRCFSWLGFGARRLNLRPWGPIELCKRADMVGMWK